jgi:hypothetical protein
MPGDRSDWACRREPQGNSGHSPVEPEAVWSQNQEERPAEQEKLLAFPGRIETEKKPAQGQIAPDQLGQPGESATRLFPSPEATQQG